MNETSETDECTEWDWWMLQGIWIQQWARLMNETGEAAEWNK